VSLQVLFYDACHFLEYGPNEWKDLALPCRVRFDLFRLVNFNLIMACKNQIDMNASGGFISGVNRFALTD
jgi:hypothetical protein